MSRTHCSFILATLLLCTIPPEAGATCPGSRAAASPLETSLWGTATARGPAGNGGHSCWWDFVLGTNRWWKTNRSFAWPPSTGYSSACDITLPYAKFLNSAYLIGYGLRNGSLPDPFTRPPRDPNAFFGDPHNQWHSTNDYNTNGEGFGLDNRYHRTDFYYYSGASALAGFFRPAGGQQNLDDNKALVDSVTMECTVFDIDDPGGNGDVIVRGMTIEHEQWHAWQHQHDFVEESTIPASAPLCRAEQPPLLPASLLKDCSCSSGGHLCGKNMGGPCPGNDICDWYYFHKPEDYEFGGMFKFQTNLRPILFHSPYQVEVEWACDVANHPDAFVPAGVSSRAGVAADGEMTSVFVHPPPFRCSAPTMFVPAKPSTPTTGGAQCKIPGIPSCDVSTPCTGGDVCDTSSHCCFAQVK